MRRRIVGWIWACLIAVGSVAAGEKLLAQSAAVGQWSSVQQWPVEAIHVSLLPTGKVLFWQSWRESAGIWNPATSQFETAGFTGDPDGGGPLRGLNPFCSGHTFLPDGRLFVAGGHIENYNGDNRADIYDPWTNSWVSADPLLTQVPVMGSTSTNTGSSGKRWYPSATLTGAGEVLVMSGDVVSQGVTNRTVQLYSPTTNSWRTLTGALRPTDDRLPEYPRVFQGPDGRAISLSDNSSQTEFLSLTGSGAWTPLGQTLDSDLHNYGPAVMYDTGKIAYIGGGNTPTRHISLLDLNEPTPAWTYGLEDMARGRRHNNATILADGTVLITGGSSVTGWNDPAGFVAQAELWNPQTEEVTPLASASSIYRGYHSTAVLLPDGRVLVTGGNHDDASGLVEQKNAEIYSPAYLFKGPRPTVTAAPATGELGDSIFVQTPDAADVVKALIVAPGSVTHAQNWSQRSNVLDFSLAAGGLNVALPSTGNEAPPGYYMLFLVNSAGVPSLANWVQVTPNVAEPVTADFNGDGQVDGSDLLIWQQHAGGPAGATSADGDADGDGIVDDADLGIWESQFGTFPLAASQAAAAPEPGGGLLASSALAVAVVRIRRRG